MRRDERELAVLAAKIHLQAFLGKVPPGTGWEAVFNLGYRIGSSEDPMACVTPEATADARKLMEARDRRIVPAAGPVPVAAVRGG